MYCTVCLDFDELSFSMATRKESKSPHEQHMARKKKVVNDLLALRRMKLIQKKKEPPLGVSYSNQSGVTYEAYRALDESSSYTGNQVTREQVKKLISGTTLEAELKDIYGENTLENLTDHFIERSQDYSGSPTSINQEDSNALQSTFFLHNLLKERKLKQENKRQKHYTVEQNLLKKKKSLQDAKHSLLKRNAESDASTFGNSDNLGVDSDSSEENVMLLVDKVKQKIPVIENRIKQLRAQNRVSKKPIVAQPKPVAIDYTFKPSQQEQVKIVRDIVEEIVSSALNICISSDDSSGSLWLKMLLSADSEKWENMMIRAVRFDAIGVIMEEVIEEVTNIVARKTAEECIYLAKMTNVLATDLIVNASEMSSAGKQSKKVKDNESNLIDQTYMEMNMRRKNGRKDLWSHTQSTVSTVAKAPKQKQPQPTEPVVESEGDAVTLSYEQTLLKEEFVQGPLWTKYVQEELLFWESYTTTITPGGPVDLSYSRILGISCLSISPNNKLLAFGTFSGDVLVYDMSFQPFRPIKCVSYVGKTPDSIAHIAWSLDQSRIITLSRAFCLIVWSVSLNSFSSPPDIRHLDVPQEKDINYAPQQLTALVMLEAKYTDFAIAEGPLANSISKDSFASPIFATFAPVISLSGSQNFVVVGFSSGEVMKCNLQSKVSARVNEYRKYANEDAASSMFINGQNLLSQDSKISQGIPVELFRYHKLPITVILFLRNNGDMIVMDSQLNISLWKEEKEFMTGFKWFIPRRKLKFSAQERVMVPKDNERVIFEDVIALKRPMKGRKRKEIIERERRETMAEIATLQLQNRNPWHRDDQDLDSKAKEKKKAPKFVTITYAPTREEIIDPTGDQLFHILTRQTSTNSVVRYATRTYKLSSHEHIALVKFSLSYDGTKLYFMFLFDKHLPNIKSHVTIVDLDLSTMDMLQSTLIKVDLDKEEYDLCLTKKQINFCVSRIHGCTRSEYIFCYFAGRTCVFSALTGTEVAKCPQGKKSKTTVKVEGLELPKKLCSLIGNIHLNCLCPDSETIFLMLLPQSGNVNTELIAGMFKFINNNAEQKQKMSSGYTELVNGSSDKVTSIEGPSHAEQFIQENKYSTKSMPKELYIRMTLNSIIDQAVAVATGNRMTKEQRGKLWQQDWDDMQKFFISSEV